VAALEVTYHAYLADQDVAAFLEKVSRRYTIGTLERLVRNAPRLTRRAAVLAVGLMGDYSSNAVLGTALHDEDRGVRMLAENGLRSLWCRDGNTSHRRWLASIIRLNERHDFSQARERAGQLIAAAPLLAEAWNQRAIAYFRLGRYLESIQDCRRAIELNPFHFGAVAGMGQCYLYLGNMLWALESFRRALELNPNLENIRANVVSLERKLKKS
jgi:tetratricopeptide (TPR) repeat protein